MKGKGFFAGVVRHRKQVLAGYAILSVLCVFLWMLVSVNYDINDYLPPTSPSTTAIQVMEDAFDGGIPNVRAMVRDVTVPEALAYKQQIAQLDGVTAVTWLDDALDVTVPLEMQDQKTVETYYKDGAALFTITVQDSKRTEAVDAISDLLGDQGALTGSAVSTAAATNSTLVEVAQIAAIAVVYVFFILGLTTNSWAEPVLIMVGMGVAILINNGTNLVFGEISFVTSAAGSILQLAVSLDYSVFLIHRFEEVRTARPGADPGDCMVEALSKSASSILSSGLTTVIGFVALILMQFQIGPDLGRALAKGVAFSLLTVFTFVPALVVTALPWMDRTRHKPLLPSFAPFGRLVSKIMLPMVLVLVVVMLPSYLASNANTYYYGAGHMFGTDTKVGQDTQAIDAIFGQSDTYVLLVPAGDTATQSELSAALHNLPEVTGMISYVDNAGAEIPPEYLDDATLSQLVSDGYTRMVLSVAADFEGDAAFALVEQVRSIAQEYYPDSWYLAGQGVSTYDLMDTITGDMTKDHHRRHDQGEPGGHCSGVPGAAGAGTQPDSPHSAGAVHRDRHLVQSGSPLFHRHHRLLHRLSHHQLGPAGRHRGLRHPVLGPLPRIPGNAGQKAGHCRHRGHRHHLGADHRQRIGGGGLSDGRHLVQSAVEPAGHLPGGGQPRLPDHCSAGPARHPLSDRSAHHQKETGRVRPEGGLNP